MDEGNREEFEEFCPAKIIELFSLVEAIVEKAGLDEASTNTIESVKQEIMLYLMPDKLLKKCIKKINGL